MINSRERKQHGRRKKYTYDVDDEGVRDDDDRRAFEYFFRALSESEMKVIGDVKLKKGNEVPNLYPTFKALFSPWHYSKLVMHDAGFLPCEFF